MRREVELLTLFSDTFVKCLALLWSLVLTHIKGPEVTNTDNEDLHALLSVVRSAKYSAP